MKKHQEVPRFIYTNKEILNALRRLAKDLGRSPLKREINECPYCPSEWVIYKRFGSINNALKKAGLCYKPNRISKAEALA